MRGLLVVLVACGHPQKAAPVATTSAEPQVTSEVIDPPKGFAIASGMGGMTGSVSDATGHRIAGVTVVVNAGEGKTSYNAESDVAGRFAIPNIPPGTYTVSWYFHDKQVSRDNVRFVADKVVLERVASWNVQ